MAWTAEQLREKAAKWAARAKAAEARDREAERRDRTRALILLGKTFIDLAKRGEIDPALIARADLIVKQGKGTRDLRYAIKKDLIGGGPV
jgi:predicted metal-dependent HD superfamily phosphohydrolase